MKKVVALFALMMFAAAANADVIVPKLGIDFPGTWKASAGGGSGSRDTELGYSIGAEYLHQIDDMFTVGGGLEYQLQRKIKDTSVAINFMPIYATGMVTPFGEMCCGMTPYAKLNLGYDLLHSGNSDYTGGATLGGGLYWGIGIGTKFLKDFSADLMYSSYAGTAENTGTKADITYTKIGINIGYAFDLGK